MKNLFMMLLLIASCAFTRIEAQVLASCSEDSLYSPSVAGYMKFYVILPPGYLETAERYTTVYLLHGLWGNYKDWVTNTGLVQYASHHRFIIITPDGRNSWWTNSNQVKNAMYEDYVMKDLIPFVDQKYRTLATRHGRAIAGLSMGGYGTAKFARKYPGSFFYAASFSGALSVVSTLESDLLKSKDPIPVGMRSRVEAFGPTRSEQWARNDVLALYDSVDVKQLPYLYLAVGHSDYWADATLALGAKLRQKGAAFEMHETIGAHNWLFWDQEIKTLLEKLDRYDPLNVK
jgi:S-formylglutathione hydrolase FrmB